MIHDEAGLAEILTKANETVSRLTVDIAVLEGQLDEAETAFNKECSRPPPLGPCTEAKEAEIRRELAAANPDQIGTWDDWDVAHLVATIDVERAKLAKVQAVVNAASRMSIHDDLQCPLNNGDDLIELNQARAELYRALAEVGMT